MQHAIFVKAPNKVIPDDVLTQVLSTHDTFFGAAAVLDEEGKKSLMEFSVTDKEAMQLEKLNELQLEAFETDLVLCFGKSANGVVATEDLQPYVLIEDGGKPVLIAFLDGNWPSFEQKDSNHTNEYFFVKTKLIPKVQQLYRLTKSDIEATMRELQDDLVAKELLNDAVEHGVITFLANNGGLVTHNKADNAEQDDWGWCSRKPNGFPAKTETPAKELSAFQKMKQTAKAAVNTLLPADSDKKEQKAADIVAAKITHTSEKIGPTPKLGDNTALISMEFVDYPVPEGYANLNNKDKKKWVGATIAKHGAGKFPNEYKKITVLRLPKVAAPIGDGRPLATETTKPAISNEAMKAALEAADNAAKEKTPTKDLENHNVPSVPAEPKTSVGLPMLQPDKRAHTKAHIDGKMFKTVLDRNARVISDPVKYKEVVARLPNFGEQIGLEGGNETAYNWPYESLVELGRVHPEALAVLACNAISERNVLKAAKPATDSKIIAPDGKKIIAPSPAAVSKFAQMKARAG